jgi:hypothetical protein
MLDSILADRALVVDWVKFSTMFVVSRLLAGGSLDDQAWLMSSLYTLLGFTAYHLVVKKAVPNNTENVPMKKVINTWLKVGTMLLVSRLLSGEPLNEKWMMSSLYTILGFNAFDVVTSDLIPAKLTKNENVNAAIVNAVNVTTMSVVSRLLSGEPLNEKWMMGTLYTWVGFAAYDLGTSALLA